jgi:hypothetical protein
VLVVFALSSALLVVAGDSSGHDRRRTERGSPMRGHQVDNDFHSFGTTTHRRHYSSDL